MSIAKPATRRIHRPLLLATAVALAASLATACGNSTAGNTGNTGNTDGTSGGTTGNSGSLYGPGGPGCSGAVGTPGGSGMPMRPGTGPQGMRTSVYFLHGEQVSPAPRTVAMPTTAAGALRTLLAGPDRYERDHGRTTAIPAGTRLRSVVVRRHVATVDLTGRYDDGGGTLSMRARLAQVVFTATRFPSIQKVGFELDGKPVTVFGGEGIVLDHPVGRADFEDLAPLVLVESPLIGDTVRTPVRVWGSANTFEGTLRLKLTDAAKHTAADVRVTATSGSGTRGTFDVTIPYKATRSGAGTLTAYWNSPKDGRPVIEDTVPLNLLR
ncbi:Gmad2 immunoglobulin-like domain-containing protein [Streptomyces acidiscabies]|uniref:Gmad2 immunoglobulin-like domain-containing protein n=1 Tax=Streptomyces acidiscabies TaxID=42234 RepID=UPI00073F7EB0|nr:Gmad2 immunoglobulin-like domain-containing protein [Streptomyces acidiscabies]GAQ50348.1 sporulation and spore germination [Streptomyces acidiscabies]GAV37251.1 sporulation and spore germination [Streptomyces acidiscabies]